MVFKIFNDFLSLIFPDECIICDCPLVEQEQKLCNACYASLPRIQNSLFKEKDLSSNFFGRVNIEEVSVFLHYQKGGEVQRLMRELKYNGDKELGFLLGAWYALEHKSKGFFADIEIIVPVPLHKKKQKKRGYNQSEWIARGIQSITGIPYSNGILIRNIYSETQTKKGRIERLEDLESKFRLVNPSMIKDKKILLVDDVLTTGATIEACALELLKAENCRLSVAAIAYSY